MSSPTRTKNNLLWDTKGGTHVFLVGSTMYKLDSKALRRNSGFFDNILGLPVSSSSEGTTEKSPIKIPNHVEEPEFEIFATRVYGREVNKFKPFGKPVLLKLLNLSRYFLSPSLKEFTLKEIHEQCFCFEAVELLEACYKHNTRYFFKEVFQRLAERSLSTLTINEVERIRISTYIGLVMVRERITEHIHCIVTVPPPVKHHSNCTDIVSCEFDFKAVWWNVMGRLLLDAHYSMFWIPEDAVKEFEKSSFGRMGRGCVMTMMDFIRLKQFGLDVVRERISATANDIASHITEIDGGDESEDL